MIEPLWERIIKGDITNPVIHVVPKDSVFLQVKEIWTPKGPDICLMKLVFGKTLYVFSCDSKILISAPKIQMKLARE